MAEPANDNNWESLWEDLGLTNPAQAPPPGRAEPPSMPARVAETWTPESPAAQTEGSSRSAVDTEAAGSEEPEATREKRREGPGGRGRRRGRRAGRSAEAAAEREATTPPETAEPPVEGSEAPAREAAGSLEGDSEQPREERRGRRRRRRRRSGEREAAEQPASESTEADREEPAEEAAETANETDLDEDDLSNWSVPSWQELIASLYRPDR